MPKEVDRDPGGPDETILEVAVRDRLTRQQIRDLLDSMGGSTAGNREEMAERLLGLRGLKERAVLDQLSVDDLKRIEKRFGIPESQTGGLLTAFFSDPHEDLVNRISKAAAKERAPRPRPGGPLPAPEIPSRLPAAT